jgi:phosphoglycerol transferase MdoB-like AlkP superfamily enzyme
VIKPVEQPKQTRNNAVVYSDHALGEFIHQAKNSAYWKDTIFLIVADHCAQADGENLVPIEDFHIPGAILGADIQPKVVRTVSSQIDLAPTLMSMMGISGKHPMIGRDLTKPEELNSEGRALMQFSDYFALMQGNQVTVLRPSQPALVGQYDPVLKNLTLESEANEQAFNLSLAHSLLPSWLYRTQKYTLKTR